MLGVKEVLFGLNMVCEKLRVEPPGGASPYETCGLVMDCGNEIILA